MDTAAHHLTHFLRDDAGHGMDRLEESAETLAEIRDLDAVSRAEQHHHRLADDSTEPKQDRGNYSGERRRYEHSSDGLKAICTQRVGGFLEATGHVPQGIF